MPGEICTLALPPPETIIDGIRTMTLVYPCAVGIDSMRFSSSVRRRRALWTSTIGLSPVTVTVSSSVPTRMSAFTVETKSAGNSSCSRLNVLKPARVKVTV